MDKHNEVSYERFVRINYSRQTKLWTKINECDYDNFVEWWKMAELLSRSINKSRDSS